MSCSSEKYRVNGSFRDPYATVYEYNKRIFRFVHKDKEKEFVDILNKHFVKKWIEEKKFIETVKISNNACPAQLKPSGKHSVFEHPKLDFISYPYEWCFEQLRDAAIFFLKLQIEALDKDVVFKDASAYNIQFIGANPIFIDAFSLRKYVVGEYWQGYYQFCKEFLYPILLSYYNRKPPSDFYRGHIHGVDAQLTSALLPMKSRLSLWTNIHVHLNASSSSKQNNAKRSSFDKKSYMFLLQSMLKFILKLKKRSLHTTWSNYTNVTSYSEENMEIKKSYIKDFLNNYNIKSLIDLGCNDGFYSQLAFDEVNDKNNIFVVGVDGDEEAVNKSYTFAKLNQNNLLNLKIDLMSPSPEQGFMCKERFSLFQRHDFDASFALALIHHLIIGSGANMDGAVKFLTSFSKRGIIEFVEKSDPRVQQMLNYREDVFDGYNIENFLYSLSQRCEITKQEQISNHRYLFSFKNYK